MKTIFFILFAIIGIILSGITAVIAAVITGLPGGGSGLQYIFAIFGGLIYGTIITVVTAIVVFSYQKLTTESKLSAILLTGPILTFLITLIYYNTVVIPSYNKQYSDTAAVNAIRDKHQEEVNNVLIPKCEGELNANRYLLTNDEYWDKQQNDPDHIAIYAMLTFVSDTNSHATPEELGYLSKRFPEQFAPLRYRELLSNSIYPTSR